MPVKRHKKNINNNQHYEWHKVKHQILSHWTKLSEVEVEQTGGDMHALANLVAKKYSDEKARQFINHFDVETKKNEPDDEDEEGMTRFNDFSADYTGLALNEAEQEEFLQPNLEGMDALQDSLKNEKNKRKYKFEKHINSAKDEFKPNQDPHFEKNEDITLGRSNSSANTTSKSAPTSSGAKKLL